MEELTERLEFKLSKDEKAALRRLAEHDGVSMGSAIRSAVRALAKRKKVWQ